MSEALYPTGWFADNRDEEVETGDRYSWQPVLQGEGVQFPLDVWFATEADCVAFIKSKVIGRGLLGDHGA